MALSLKFYDDSALTTEHVGNLVVTQAADGSTPPVDNLIYVGSTVASRKFQAQSNPGVAQITITPTDAAPGTGHPATEVKLAATLVGLDTATAGAALNLGTQINSGAAGAKPVYIRVDDTTGVVGTSTELSLQTNTVIETDL